VQSLVKKFIFNQTIWKNESQISTMAISAFSFFVLKPKYL